MGTPEAPVLGDQYEVVGILFFSFGKCALSLQVIVHRVTGSLFGAFTLLNI